MKDKDLQALLDSIGPDDGPEADDLDPRWEALAMGTLGPEDEARLLALGGTSRSGGDLAAAFARCTEVWHPGGGVLSFVPLECWGDGTPLGEEVLMHHPTQGTLVVQLQQMADPILRARGRSRRTTARGRCSRACRPR